MKKLFLSCLLSALCLTTAFSANYSGTCGDNLIWDLTDGVLTISGTGAMFDYDILKSTSRAPWYANSSSIQEISIGDSVTSIGNYAFYGCSGLTSVTIPSSITSIGNFAFDGCSNLTSVTIPNSVTSIGKGAFYNCSGLTSVSTPNNITSIGSSTFSNCSGLTSITIPNSVTSIGEDAFRDCSGLTSLTIGNNVTSIGDYAFSGCSILKSFEFPNSLTSIGKDSFHNCDSLTYVTIPKNVTSIGYGAFSYTSYVSSSGTYIHSRNITSVVWNAKKCNGYNFGEQVESFTFGDDVEEIPANLCKGMNKLTSIIIPNSVTSIGEDAFSGCSGLTSIEIPNSVTSIGDNAFSGCSGLTSVSINDIVPWCAISFGNSSSNPLFFAKNLYLNDELITNLVIPNSVTSIGNNAFYNCSNLTSVTIPNSVTSIGDDAFSGCSGLVSVDIKDITSWCAISFGNSSSNPLCYANKLYLDDELLTNLVLPNNITSIENYVFYNCTSLTSIVLPDNVMSIGNSAFEHCTSLTSIKIPNNVAVIGEYAFKYCSSLTSVLIEAETPPRIGYSVFAGDYQLESIYIPCGTMDTYTYDWSSYASKIKYQSLPYTITTNAQNGNITINPNEFTICSDITLTAKPDYRYHFVQWTDGNTENPRTIELTQDTTFTAEFAPNKYAISVICDTTHGSIIGERGEFDYLTELTYIAVPKYGYHFDYWKRKYNPDGDYKLLWDYSYGAPYSNPDNGLYYGSKVTDTNKGIKLNASGYCYFSKEAYNGILELSYSPRVSGFSSLKIETWEGEPASSVKPTSLSLIATTREVAELTTVAVELTDSQNNIFIERLAEKETVLQKIQFTPSYYKFYGDIIKIKVEVEDSIEAIFAPNIYTISATDNPNGIISGTGSFAYLTQCAVEAIPNEGYYFTQWSDGNTDNPRSIVLTQDTSLTAEFSNQYSINVSCDELYGAVDGKNGVFEYLSEHTYKALPNYGYHFSWWSDGVRSNPRTIVLTQDTSIIALFTENSYRIIDQTDTKEGYISGAGYHSYMDTLQLTAIPYSGYHFIQWSDGVTINPRQVVLTQDTTFTAEFGIDKSGTCGEDNVLIWNYDEETKTLTISGSGALTKNFTYGAEAPNQMLNLIIGNEVTEIGNRAFYGMSSINHLVIGGSVTTIRGYAFAECRNFDDITCYATIVPTITENTFANVGNKQYIYLYVPEGRQRAYLRDTYWGEFDVQVKNAETVTEPTENVVVTPSENSAEIVWPIVNEAETYEITITKDDQTVCTLTFNAQGQLIGIAFAPARETARQQQAEGFRFTITGLTSNTQYGYSIVAKDASNNSLDTKSGSFTTTGEIPTAIEDVRGNSLQCTKILRNGQIVILRGDKTYSLQGQEVK